jgi:hypothetical protein
MHRIINFWQNLYFTEPILLIIIVIAFVIAVRKRKIHPQLKFFPLYLGSFLLTILSSYVFDLFLYETSYYKLFKLSGLIGNYFVTVIELITFSYCLYSITQAGIYRKLIKTLISITLSIFFLLLIQAIYLPEFISQNRLHILYMIESSVLLIACLFPFIELFKFPPVQQLLQSADFWITGGLAFYLLGTFPLTIVSDYFFAKDLKLYVNLFSLINICYMLLFLMVIKGYFCKKREHIKVNH